MVLEPLELPERAQVGIRVVESHHESDRHQRSLVLQMVQERATVRVVFLRTDRGGTWQLMVGRIENADNAL